MRSDEGSMDHQKKEPTPMKERVRAWLSSLRPSTPSLRFIFTVMYIGVLGSVAYVNVIMNCGRQFLGGNAPVLAILLLSLFGLERFESKRYRYEAPAGVAMCLMLARMLMFEVVATIDCSAISLLLYPVIPFSAYFTFGPGASIWLSIFYVMVGLRKMWQQDPTWYITSPMSAVILVAFLFVLLFMQIMARVIHSDDASRKRTEQLLSDLEASHVKLQAYAAQASELAATEERNRLARDIHDTVGHYLTAVNIQLEKALAYRDRDPAEAAKAIRDAKTAAGDALREVRRSVGALRSSDTSFSLRSALEELVQGAGADGIEIRWRISGDEDTYDRVTLMVLYRVAQEGLTNIRKHAGARKVDLEVDLGPEMAHLHLRDDGRGFDPSGLEAANLGSDDSFGLRGLRERLDAIDGHLTVQSAEGEGTELIADAPKRTANAEPTVKGSK